MSKSNHAAKGKPRPPGWKPTRTKEGPLKMMGGRVVNEAGLREELGNCGASFIKTLRDQGLPVIPTGRGNLFDLDSVFAFLKSREKAAPAVHSFKGRAQRRHAG